MFINTIFKKELTVKIILSISILLSTLLLGACASAPTPVAEAINYALVSDLTLRKLVDRCNDVSNAAKQTAWKAKRNWWKRNGAMVEAADFGLSQVLVDVSGQRPSTGALVAIGLSLDISREAQSNVDSTLSGNKDAACKDVLEDYYNGEYDLKDNSSFYSMLVKLQQQKDTAPIVPELQMAMPKGGKKSYGKSTAVVERIVKREGCNKPKIQLLKRNGSYEVYDAQCGKETMLVRCEWRQCKVTQ